MKLLITLLFILCMSNGSPSEWSFHCYLMTLENPEKEIQENDPPYNISVDSGRFFKAGHTVTVSIGKISPDIHDFIGFYVQVRPVGSSSTVGRFSSSPGVERQKCNRENDAAIQADLTPKSTITVQWTPPEEGYPGNLVVKAAVAQENMYWNNIVSEELSNGEPTAQCVEPAAPENAIQTRSGLLYGDTITYKCENGYEAENENDLTRTCQIDGQWSGKPPVCNEASSRGTALIYNWTTYCIGIMILSII